MTDLHVICLFCLLCLGALALEYYTGQMSSAKDDSKAQPKDCSGIFIDPAKLPKTDGEGWETSGGQRFTMTYNPPEPPESKTIETDFSAN